MSFLLQIRVTNDASIFVLALQLSPLRPPKDGGIIGNKTTYLSSRNKNPRNSYQLFYASLSAKWLNCAVKQTMVECNVTMVFIFDQGELSLLDYLLLLIPRLGCSMWLSVHDPHSKRWKIVHMACKVYFSLELVKFQQLPLSASTK